VDVLPESDYMHFENSDLSGVDGNSGLNLMELTRKNDKSESEETI
jgi:hypothetical protein